MAPDISTTAQPSLSTVPISTPEHPDLANNSLPLTSANLTALGASLTTMQLSNNLRTPSPSHSLLVDPKVPADSNINMAESICTTCENAGAVHDVSQEAAADGEEQTAKALYESYAGGAYKKLRLTWEERKMIFCCKSNKIICMGPGVDEDENQEVIERFVKDVAYDEKRYLSKEDIKAAFLASKFIIEVQRSFDVSTQTRYFVSSIVFKKKYVEVHPRDIFIINPLKIRNNHVFEFVKCRDDKHTKKPIPRRITLLEKPTILKGTEVYLEPKGVWFDIDVVGSWGHVWYASDEYLVSN